MKAQIAHQEKVLQLLKDMATVNFNTLPVDTLCLVSNDLQELALGKGEKRYFSHKDTASTCRFYAQGATSDTSTSLASFKYVVLLEPNRDETFRAWLHLHRKEGTNTLSFELREFFEGLPKHYLSIIEEETSI